MAQTDNFLINYNINSNFMKKKLLFLAALVLASLQLSAANVDLTTAQQSHNVS